MLIYPFALSGMLSAALDDPLKLGGREPVEGSLGGVSCPPGSPERAWSWRRMDESREIGRSAEAAILCGRTPVRRNCDPGFVVFGEFGFCWLLALALEAVGEHFSRIEQDADGGAGLSLPHS